MTHTLVVNVAEFSKIDRRTEQHLKRAHFLELAKSGCVLEKDFMDGHFSRILICSDPYRSESHQPFNLTAHYGDVYSETFKPKFTPKEMLCNGVFEGRYLNSLYGCFPLEWWENASISIHTPDVTRNFFRVRSRNSLHDWINKMDAVRSYDPRGWFEWYCFYFLGRRIEGYDDWQIGRWRKFVRHQAQLKANLVKYQHPARYYDPVIYPVNRQALMQWSWDPFPKVGQESLVAIA